MAFKKKSSIVLIIFIVTIFLYHFYNKLEVKKTYFPIKHIEIISNFNNVNKNTVSKRSEIYLKEKSFFNFNIKNLKKEIEKIEWVKSVNVRRVYPDKVKIFIVEHKAIAIWNNKEYFNKSGKLFKVNQISKNLPKLNSKNNQNVKMFNYLSSFTKHLSKNNINDKIIKIEENEIRSIKIFLYSGININLGSRNIDNRIKTFFKIYKKLKSSDLKKIRYIDMRYSNGFSIGWK